MTYGTITSGNNVTITQEPITNLTVTEIPVVDLDINQVAQSTISDVEYRTAARTNYINNPRARQQQNYGAQGYIYQPTGQYLYTLGPAAPNVTGDIDVRVKVALDDYSKGGSLYQELLGKYGGSGNRSFIFRLGPAGIPEFLWYPLGTTGVQKIATVNPNFIDGQTYWIRVTLDVDNGAGGNTVTFYQSNDGTTWTVIGTPVVTAGTTVIFASTQQIITSGSSAVNTSGNIYAAEIYDGIAGTLVYGWDVGTNWNATTSCVSFIATTGQPVFLSYVAGNNQPTNDYGFYPNATGANTNLVRNSDVTYSGSSLLFTGGTAAIHGVNFRNTSGFRIPWNALQRSSIGVWVKVPTGSPAITLRIRRSHFTAITGGTSLGDSVSSNYVLNDTMGWTLMTGDFSSSATTAAIGFRVEYAATPAANAQFLVSNYILEALNAGSVGDYFDGSFTVINPIDDPVTRWESAMTRVIAI